MSYALTLVTIAYLIDLSGSLGLDDGAPEAAPAGLHGDPLLEVHLLDRELMAYALTPGYCSMNSVLHRAELLLAARLMAGLAWSAWCCVRRCRAHNATLRPRGCLEEGFLMSR